MHLSDEVVTLDILQHCTESLKLKELHLYAEHCNFKTQLKIFHHVSSYLAFSFVVFFFTLDYLSFTITIQLSTYLYMC